MKWVFLTTAATLLTSVVASPPAMAAPKATTSSASFSASISKIAGGIEVVAGNRHMQILALTDEIVRVRIARDGTYPEDASWAVAAAVRARHAAVVATADGFETAKLRVRILGPQSRLVVEDLQGHVISADAETPVVADGRGFTLRKQLPAAEHIFGLGDKTGSDLDRRGMTYVDWNTDAFGFSSSQDPIYKSIPFFIGAGNEAGAYGLLFDNSWRASFDFGHKDPDTIELGAPDGPIDYYVIAGPSVAEVVRRYTDLTGKAPLPPLWSFGYQQSRYSYMTADEVRAIAGHLRAEKIPTDVIWMDIDWQDHNRPFTVNKTAFPDLPGLIKDMGRDGIKLVAISDLHVAALPNQGYAPYDTGIAANRFVHQADGATYIAPVWPGASVFPDFTDKSTRDWWGGLFKSQVEAGLAGAWNDMNEPAIFETRTKTMPLDNVHKIATDDFAPRTGSHAEIHNIYGMENTRATYDGLRTLAPKERAYVMTRASYAGGQRYSVTWTGDNSASWDHLRLSIHQIVNLGLSGFSYSGADVGGFAGGPSADLLTRWFEIGAFLPVFRDHSAKDTPRAEPWVDGPEHLAIRRRYVDERYRLMPYLYALADQNARVGDPLVRPVFYDYPAALNASCDQSTSFTVGRSILVAPPPRMESPQSYDVCLPEGGWYDYWTGRVVEGKREQGDGPIQSATQAAQREHSDSIKISETPRLDHLPLFVRAGTILPRQPLVQSTAETPQGPLSVDVYPGADCRGSLYDDDGHSMGFEKGDYRRQEIRCTLTPTGLSIRFEKAEGRYKPWWNQIKVTVHEWTGDMTTVNGRKAQATADATSRTMSVIVPGSVRSIDLATRGS